jgi:nucleoside-diphosphate-sugar epimerase
MCEEWWPRSWELRGYRSPGLSINTVLRRDWAAADPRLVQAGHVVGGLTRSSSKTELLSHLGAEPILCDVFDREALFQAVRDFNPDVMLNELTGLPDDAAQISELAGLNARIRTEGTRNLIEAARRSGSPKILAQSVAWQLPDGPDAQAVAELERSVLAESGVVLRYGQF